MCSFPTSGFEMRYQQGERDASPSRPRSPFVSRLDRCEKSSDHLRSHIDLGFQGLASVQSRGQSRKDSHHRIIHSLRKHHGDENVWGRERERERNVVLLFQHEWFFDDNEYDSIPVEINPQMPKLAPIENVHGEVTLNNETKPGEIIQHIVRAAKRRWSSPLLLETMSSLNSSNDQQASKPINISVKRYFSSIIQVMIFLHIPCSVLRPN